MASHEAVIDQERRSVLKMVSAGGTAGLVTASDVRVQAAENTDKIQSEKVEFGSISIGAAGDELPYRKSCKTRDWPLVIPKTENGYENQTTADIYIPRIHKELNSLSDSQTLMVSDFGLTAENRGSITGQTLPEEVNDLLLGVHYDVKPNEIKFNFNDGLIAKFGGEDMKAKNSIEYQKSKIGTASGEEEIEIIVEHWGECKILSHPDYILIPKRSDTKQYAKSMESQREEARKDPERPEVIVHEFENEAAYGIEVRW
jgi:hypothetical protein